MAKRGKSLHPDEPLKHPDHPRPRTRREFLAQGFSAGLGAVIGGTALGLMGAPRAVRADIAAELQDFGNANGCKVGGALTGKIPFICFDLAGGANFAGSNVLVGGAGGQLDFLSTAGYSKLGLPGDRLPPLANANNPLSNDFINQELGLAFHFDSAMLRGILERFTPGNRAFVNGAIIPARSENDTGNNPHNPMYGINRAGANGEIMALVGSRNSESGGNSLAPMSLINNEVRPTKVDRISDVRGLIDVGELGTFFPEQADRVAVMESITNISHSRIGTVNTGLQNTDDQTIKDRMLRCGYIESTYLTDRFDSSDALDPRNDPLLVGGANAPFSLDDMNDREFAKTASIARLVMEGQAGAGCITMSGYDYHTGERATGERRDLRLGRCMGACLQYAANLGKPLMLYVFSDGSLFSNGMTDDSVDGGGKGVWTGDNQQTASSFFLVFNPGGRPQLLGGTPEDQARHQQLGRFTAEGNVNTAGSPAANSVTTLVEMVCLNYMALHGEQNMFADPDKFAGHSLGPDLDRWTAFAPIV